MQHRQQHYVTRFAHDMDQLNTEVAASYNQTVQGMMYQGKSEKEAHNMAALSTKGRVQVQATLAAVKEMSGWTILRLYGMCRSYAGNSVEKKKAGFTDIKYFTLVHLFALYITVERISFLNLTFRWKSTYESSP